MKAQSISFALRCSQVTSVVIDFVYNTESESLQMFLAMVLKTAMRMEEILWLLK